MSENIEQELMAFEVESIEANNVDVDNIKAAEILELIRERSLETDNSEEIVEPVGLTWITTASIDWQSVTHSQPYTYIVTGA